MRNVPYRCALFLSLLFGSGALFSQTGPLVLQRNLAQLTQNSATIVRGRIVEAYVERHPTLRNLPTVVVKLRVDETLKGTAETTFTFREFLWQGPLGAGEVPVQYRPGQELLLLMNAPSSYGLSSPVGLEQGTFRIVRDAKGNAYARNGRNNANLFVGATQALGARASRLKASAVSMMAANQPGQLPLDDLSSVIRQLVEATDAK
jgi:hypothetical protein